MSEKQFDIIKACFWLVASIIWAQILAGVAIMGICAYGVISGVVPQGACKDFAPNIMELLVGGLAVALAFSGKANPRE